MESYLKLLVGEFQQNYKEISRAQSVYEARMKKALEQVSTAESNAPRLPSNDPWDRITALRHASDFFNSIDDSAAGGGARSNYSLQFLTPLDTASSELRDVLSAEFEDRA